ncbi:MAG: hypothetical protein R2690_06255 [Acidimicrobiales bacterium]
MWPRLPTPSVAARRDRVGPGVRGCHRPGADGTRSAELVDGGAVDDCSGHRRRQLALDHQHQRPPPADDATTETTEATDETEAVPLPVAGGSSFPAETVASVPPTGAEAPLALGAVYKVTGSSDDNPTIAVQFREPFELPTDAEYRVSVLVGNPTARRMRSSMIVTDGDLTSRVEIGDGASFEQLTPVPPPTFDPSGLAALTVPVVEAPAGGALWVEVVYGDGLAISPYYSLDAVLGRSSDGKVASSPFGRVATADGGRRTRRRRCRPGPG